MYMKLPHVGHLSYVGAGLETRVEYSFTLFVYEEGVDRAPLVVTKEVLRLLQGGVYPGHTYCSTTQGCGVLTGTVSL